LKRSSSTARSIGWLRPVLALALLLAVAGCGRPDPANRPVRPDQILNFAKLYATNCAACHGVDGQLGAGPPLADPLFLTIVPDDALLDVISNGREGTLMPSFAIEQGGILTPEQIKILAKGLKEDWLPEPDPKLPADLPNFLASSSPDETPTGDATRGEQVFARACATCHGEAGHGGPTAGDIHASAFLALTSEQFLRRITITGRHDLGMPDYRRLEGPEGTALSHQDIDDVVALLSSWRTKALTLATRMPVVPQDTSLSDASETEVTGSQHARID